MKELKVDSTILYLKIVLFIVGFIAFSVGIYVLYFTGEYPQKCVIKDIDLFDSQIRVLKC